ncbi:MAG: type IIL restriction-modification enzyme MmeI, partial [Candidatus Nanopelagicales bacterium]
VFTVWNRALSGRIKSDLRISQEITYNNFPWLASGDPNRSAIINAVSQVFEARALYDGETLASLYDPLAMPVGLVTAHKALDAVVLRAYGLRASATDAVILGKLIDRYQLLVDAGTLPN